MDAAAPDEQVRKAGLKLAIPTPWSDAGTTGTLLFGRCQGSGKTPYQVSVDLSGPRYKCSCPSRKFPCKHAVALLYLWSDGHLDTTGVAADFAAEWAAKGESQRPARELEPDAPKTPEQLAAAAARAAERDARVDAGLADLDRFLADLLGQGLAADSARGARFTEQAARMVDAQAPGAASRLRELATLGDGVPGWVERSAEDLGRLRLLSRAWQRRTDLPPDLVATVRTHLGFTTRADDVLATPGIADSWVVTGMRDADEDRVSIRRVWLRGEASGRWALVLFFAAGGATLTSNLYPGTAIDATLHFYPGRLQLRAAVGARTEQARPVTAWAPAAVTVAEAIDAWRAALAADPWAQEWPVAISGRLTHAEATFGLADHTGRVALVGDACWQLAAHASGDVTVLGEIGRDGVQPTAVIADGELVVL